MHYNLVAWCPLIWWVTKQAVPFQFLTALTNIGRRLAGVADKERRNGRLRAELATLDLNLPARVWLPLHQKPHYVLRIPPHAAAVLNSKDKVLPKLHH